MQALSFAVHIPLVCFGVAFSRDAPLCRVAVLADRRPALPDARPALDARHGRALLRPASSPARSSASRWGSSGRTSPATFGGVFGLGFAVEGFSFFTEGDLHRDLHLRLEASVAALRTFLSGIPIVLAGFTGSLTVIAVNGWMNHPTGFPARPRQGRRRPSLQSALRQQLLLARARAHVSRRVHGHRVPRRRCIRGWTASAAGGAATRRTALCDPRSQSLYSPPSRRSSSAIGAAATVAAAQPTKLAAFEGLAHTTKGAPVARPRLVRERTGRVWDPGPAPAFAARVPRSQRNGAGGSTAVPPADRPPVNVVRVRVPGHGRHREHARGCSP